jgi:hypothetical protein
MNDAAMKIARDCGTILPLILALLVGSLVLSGCGGGSSSNSQEHRRPTPTATPTPLPPGIAGFLVGGSPSVGSPISGAVITLYQASASGYGTGALQLAQADSQSDGRFSVSSFTCQTTGYSQQIYLVATGGTSSGQSNANPAIALGAGIGTCTNFAHSVVINEATTIATVWALDQFMDPTAQNVGTSATNQTGLNNSATAMSSDSFVDLSTGLAPTSFPDGLTSPTATLYSLANLLSACVNSSGESSAGCQNLFSAATPPGGVAPTTTEQAALDIARNPVNNVSALFALIPASPPFTPGLTSAPVSWVLALNYAPASADFNSPYQIALDAAGNVWVANASGDSVSELIGASGHTTALEFAPSGADLSFPDWLAFDAAGNLWVANLNSNSVSELTATSNYSTGFNFAPAGAVLSNPLSIVFDAADNLWVANFGGDSVSELLAGCSSATCTGANFNNSNTGSPGAVFSNPSSIIADVAGNLWITNFTSNSVTELLAGCSSTACTGANFNSSNTGSPGASFAAPLEVEVDGAGNIWAVNSNGNSLSELPAGCTLASCTAGNFNNSNTGSPGAIFSGPNSLAIDSSANIWVVNLSGNSVSELTASSSYATGFNFGPWPTAFAQFSVAADASGNLWIANNYDDSVSEVVGVATPILTPSLACLQLGRSVCLP